MRRRWRTIALTVAVAAAAAGTAYAVRGRLVEYQADRYAGRAARALAAGDHAAARADLRAALRWQPAHREARRRLGQMEFDLGRVEHAFLEFQALTEMHPGDAGAWLGLARVRLSAGQAAEAEAVLDEAVDAVDDRAALAPLAADLRRQEGSRTPAPPAARRAPGEAGRWPGALGTLTTDLLRRIEQRDFPGARRLVGAAHEGYPGTMLGPWLEGVVESVQGRLDTAEARLLEAHAVAPRSHRVVTNLAGVWARQRGPAYAAERLVRIAEGDPGFLYPLHIASRAYLEAREPARGEAAVRRAFDLAPASPAPYRELTEFFLELDRAGDALAACQEGLARFPDDGRLLHQVARIQARLGERQAAIEAYERLVAVRPGLDLAAAELARLLVTGRPDGASRRRALDLVRRLEDQGSADPRVLGAIGGVYLTAGGDPRRARTLLEAAVAADREQLDVRYDLAVALARVGRADLARAELRALLDAGRPFEMEPDARRLLRELDGANPGP